MVFDAGAVQIRVALLFDIQQANLTGVNLTSAQTVQTMTVLRDVLHIITPARYNVIMKITT